MLRKYADNLKKKYPHITKPEEYFPVLCDGIDIGVGAMQQILLDAEDVFEGLTEKAMREEFGPNIKLAYGQPEEWFKRIYAFASTCGIDPVSHCISGGILPLIQGTALSTYFTSIHAGDFEYDVSGRIVKIKHVVDPYNKGDILVGICKGGRAEGSIRFESYALNYDHLFIFGDGDSDKTIMNFGRERGAIPIGLYTAGDEESFERAKRELTYCTRYIVPRDYSSGAPLEQVVQISLIRMVQSSCKFDYRMISSLKQGHLRDNNLVKVTEKHLAKCPECQERNKPTEYYLG